MSTAIHNTEPDTSTDQPDGTHEPEQAELPRYTRPAELTVDYLCHRMLRLAPTAVVALAERGDVDVRLPPPKPGYCPALADVRIVRMRRTLTADTALLDELRAEHPPEKRDVHLWRMRALGGVMRILGR